MKISVIWIILVFIGGLGVGIAISIYLFAIDVDILAIPYINQEVVLTEGILIEQNHIQITIPKGTSLTLQRHMPGWEKYCIDFYVPWDQEIATNSVDSQLPPLELKKIPGNCGLQAHQGLFS